MNQRAQRRRRPPEEAPATRRECHCLIHHPQTPEERLEVEHELAYARQTGDATCIAIALAQLSGPCPVWERPRSG